MHALGRADARPERGNDNTDLAVAPCATRRPHILLLDSHCPLARLGVLARCGGLQPDAGGSASSASAAFGRRRRASGRRAASASLSMKVVLEAALLGDQIPARRFGRVPCRRRDPRHRCRASRNLRHRIVRNWRPRVNQRAATASSFVTPRPLNSTMPYSTCAPTWPFRAASPNQRAASASVGDHAHPLHVKARQASIAHPCRRAGRRGADRRRRAGRSARRPCPASSR